MASSDLADELMELAALQLSLQASPPDDSTIVLTCSFREGPVHEKQRHTLVWIRDGEEWHCVMHRRTPVPTTH